MAEPEARETATGGPQEGTFELRMTALEAAVEKLESGSLTLDEAIAEFERGVVAWRQCQDLLRRAEKRIEVLCEEASLEDSGRAGEPPLSWKSALSERLAEVGLDWDPARESKGEEGED